MDDSFSATHLLFEHVKIVYNYSDEKVQSKKRSANNEYDEVKVRVQVGFSLRLEILTPGIDCVSHDFHPTLKGRLE